MAGLERIIMKPYGITTDDYGDTGCCPGHDKPVIYKWSGKYSSTHAQRSSVKSKKIQNRLRRRKDKQKLKEW